ncbi:hypothetical protein GSS87_05185 [Corynebacterium sp. 4HC-13]|nr:hypothetical protein [Corynebacterium anserum]
MMGVTDSPIADLKDTLLPWASTAEAALSARMREVDLFVDLDISGDQLERYTRFFGTFLQRQLAAGSSPESLLAVCPALTAATLIARAARFNKVGQLPQEYWAGLGLEPTPDRVSCVEGKYAHILSAAGLNPMDEAVGGPDGEVGRLFMHVGIATDWLPEIIERIDSRRLEGTALENATEEASAVVEQFSGEELQVGPLCTLQPDIATRLFTPIVRIIRHAAANPVTWEYSVPALKLPSLIFEDLVEELRERPAGTLRRRHSVGVAQREDQPRLRLDVPRNRIVLRLPSQPLPPVEEDDTAEIRWRVDVDGQPFSFRTGRSEHLGRCVSEILDIPVRRPMREINVHNLTHGQHWTLPVIGGEDPALIFSERGVDLTRLESLHRVAVDVVCPADTVAVDPVQDRPVTVVWERAMKTWEGWVIRRLDLTDALSLYIEKPGEHRPAMNTMRAVDPRQRVLFIEPDDVAEAVETVTGQRIHSSSLRVEFPPTVSGSSEIWHLSVSAYAGPGEMGVDVSEEEPLEVPAEGGVFDVFDPEAYDSPWVGEYLVRLRGPRNESFRHEFALIEGLRVTVDIEGASAQTRLPLTTGLSPATVVFHPGVKPFEEIPPITLGAGDRYATTVVETDAGDALPIVVNPPRLRYQLPLTGEDPLWRTEAMRMAASWVDTDTRFRVRPGAPITDPRFVVRDRHGAPACTVKLTTQDNVTWWAELSRIASTLKLLSQGTCELEFIDERAGRRVSVRMARIVEDSSLDVTYGDHHRIEITSDDPSRLEGKAMWVWPLTAPWESARYVKIGETLPPELRDAGPLAVQLVMCDRFNFLRAPEFPGPRAVRVEHEGFFGSDDMSDPFAQLSSFLAGESAEPPRDAQVLPTLWDVLAGGLKNHLDSDYDNAVMNDLRSSLQTALTAHPAASMHAMSQSLVPAADRPAQYIQSGLVHVVTSSKEDEELARQVSDEGGDQMGGRTRRSDAPWIAAMEILHDLFHEEEGSLRSKELRQELVDAAGPTLLQTAETGRDSTLETACIDATTVHIAQMDPAQQKAVLDAFFGGAGVVPDALSDENTRLISVFETFSKRERLSQLLGNPELMTAAVKILRRVKSTNRQLYLSARVRFDRLDGVDTDNPANRWALAPVLSMVFALAARMHAHGKLTSVGKLPRVYPTWSEMARLVPDLVTGDLVSAEAMVLGIFGPDLQEDVQEEHEAE